MPFVVFLLLLLGLSSYASPVVDEIREKFPYIESKVEVDSYISELSNNNTVSSQGYLAAMYFFKSKYANFPITKYKFFKKGKTLLNSLIQNNANNVELRYIRYIFQHQIPKFLGYHNNKIEDFKVLDSSKLTKKELRLLLKLNNISEVHAQKIIQLLKQ